jgi:hypothetical protein
MFIYTIYINIDYCMYVRREALGQCPVCLALGTALMITADIREQSRETCNNGRATEARASKIAAVVRVFTSLCGFVFESDSVEG